MAGPDAATGGLARAAALLRPEERPREASTERGYIDLVGPAAPASPGPVQGLMLTRPLARVYERWWRPALGRLAKGAFGPGMAGERRIAQELLGLRLGDRALDVACGTGAFTRDLGLRVGFEGLSVGVDLSEAMLARAVAETGREGLPQVAFVRGDAQELPFRDGTFDGVCCFAGLNLFADPERALERMAAVLVPGGRIALFTSAGGRSIPLRAAGAVTERATGMRMFGPSEVVEALEARGFTDLRQRLTGVTQFVGGRLGSG